jgi:hypothetical protein
LVSEDWQGLRSVALLGRGRSRPGPSIFAPRANERSPNGPDALPC